MKYRLLFCLVLMLSACQIGCKESHSLGKVSGTVTYEGKPLAQGNIVFQVASGRDATAEIRDGQIVNISTFERNDGVTVGNVRLAVSSTEVTGTRQSRSEENPKETYTSEIRSSVIPLRYGNVETSGLSYDIVKGENNLNIELTK